MKENNVGVMVDVLVYVEWKEQYSDKYMQQL